MQTIQGKGVFGGIAIGKIYLFERAQQQIKRTHVEDPQKELERFYAGCQKAQEELQILYDKAVKEVGETNAMIFQIHQMMLEDEDYTESVENIIKSQKTNAEYAIGITTDNFTKMFASMDDDYMRGRAADVKDISERLLKVLGGGSDVLIKTEEPVVIAANDLSPSETVQLNKDKILGFITQGGSENSHTAILARTMNLPAVIGVGDQLTPEMDGQLCAVDGFSGCIYVDPDEPTLIEMRQKQKQVAQQAELLQQLRGRENITLDGKKIDIFANIGNPGDIGAVFKNDGGGIGLFRSEFSYLETRDFPSEEELFAVYKQTAENMAGKKVVIRTLDIGADKQIDYFGLPKEENPAMGYRAIRICLKQPDIFRTQLRALLRASAFGNISIMFPMITSTEEIKQIKLIVESVKQELSQAGIQFNQEIETGIMIETPAAAMISDELAEMVDFFSVGTNDLTQYTLAIDRQNAALEDFYNPHHKGLLRMLKMVADNAHKAGIWMGICGELAADLSLTEFFLSIGVDELSVSPSYILPLRQKIRETSMVEASEKAALLLK